jgi:hypothetical protein
MAVDSVMEHTIQLTISCCEYYPWCMALIACLVLAREMLVHGSVFEQVQICFEVSSLAMRQAKAGLKTSESSGSMAVGSLS